jgi:hypothetical protein
MLRLVRFVALVVMTLLVLSLVIAVGAPETGPLEKAVAALAIVALVAALRARTQDRLRLIVPTRQDS